MNDVERIVMQTLDEQVHKPERYHFICSGGAAAITLIDEWSDSPEYTCRRQGLNEWATPACKECTGLKKEAKALTDRQEAQNYAMKSLADEIVRNLSA